MNYEIHQLYAKDYKLIKSYIELREPGICDYMFLDQYIWREFYDSKYFYTDKGLFWIMQLNGSYFTMLPMCKAEDLVECFSILVDYFNNTLGVKVQIHIADEEAIDILKLDSNKFTVVEDRTYYDYVYNGKDLRTLSGKKFHKKKNHVNSFMKNYKDRYEYRSLCCKNLEDIKEFLDSWYEHKESDDSYNRLIHEQRGLIEALEHCKELEYKMGGIYIDGKLQGFSLASYMSSKNMVFIHIEKANPQIRGLYNFLNQQFLIHEYPTVRYVNREDDMGLEGLRVAKMSYRPEYLAKKYSIKQI